MIASLLSEPIGSVPLIGVTTFLPKEHAGEVATKIKLIRSTEAEKREQIDDVHAFQQARNPFAPSGETDHVSEIGATELPKPKSHDGHGLKYLKDTARARKNVFEALMQTVKTYSLGQISHALYDVGGEYRRNSNGHAIDAGAHEVSAYSELGNCGPPLDSMSRGQSWTCCFWSSVWATTSDLCVI